MLNPKEKVACDFCNKKFTSVLGERRLLLIEDILDTYREDNTKELGTFCSRSCLDTWLNNL